MTHSDTNLIYKWMNINKINMFLTFNNNKSLYTKQMYRVVIIQIVNIIVDCGRKNKHNYKSIRLTEMTEET